MSKEKRIKLISGLPQTDWNEADTTKPSYLKNKPTTVDGYGITDAATLDESGRVSSTQLPISLQELNDISGASVGQIVKIKSVDSSGNPTAWEAVELPSGAYTVNLTMGDGGNITADKTFSEIKAAYDDGKVVAAKFEDTIVPLISLIDSDADFAMTIADPAGMGTVIFTCTSGNVWSMSQDVVPAQVQSDYEQNDSSSKDYIKNRPFYEATETTDISGTSVTISAADGSTTHDSIPLQVGQEWKVTAVGKSPYEETFIVAENEQGEPYLGTTNAQPVYIRQTETLINDSFISTIGLTALILTCLSGTYSQIVTKTIDPKFLPEIDTRSLGITGASVGQVPVVKSVDGNGRPTEWEAGDSKPFVVTVTYGGNALTADKTHAEIVAAYAKGVQINAKIVNYPGLNAPCILPLFLNNSDLVFAFSGSGVQDGSAMAMTAIDFNGNWSVSLTELATLGDIPTSLKNPQSLVLASEGESKVYDGSSAVNVVIPYNTKVMTVTAAGAKGDGVTDDTAAFKTALANYRNVFVPGGTYKLTEGITIRDACKLELAPDAVLNFTQTTGNCISMKMSAYLCGNHAVIEVPYGFSGNVVYVSTALSTSVTDVPPFTKWDPQWKTGRYITDISISKQDSRGFHYSIDGGCSGTAIYIEADGSATSKFIWGLNFSGLRIAGAFSYGIHAKTTGSGYNHEMRLEALIDACEIGLCLEDCNNAYASITVQPRAALTTDSTNVVYAKYGIQLIRSRNADLSGARVWDWNSNTSLWTSDADCEYQHIAMIGDCSGTILNDFLYYEMPSYDIRSLIYTDTPSNLEKINILQEPFTRWFKPVDKKPVFYDGYSDHELLLKSEFDSAFQTDMVATFDNKLLKSTNSDGTIFNNTGYQSGAGWSIDGVTLNVDSEYATVTCTGFIPCAENAVIRLKGMSFASGNDYCRVVLFDSSKAKLMHVNRANLISNASSYYINNYSETEDGCQFTIVSASAAYFKLNVFTSTLGASPAISVNEEMSYRQEGYLADGIKVKKTAVEGLDETSLGITGASVGQTVKIKAVDENGIPTEWEAVDFSPATLKTWTEADLVVTT